MHLYSHPKRGQLFKIKIKDAQLQGAIYDVYLNGALFSLTDWADRIEQDKDLARSEKKIALEFFIRRCLPELAGQALSTNALNFDSVVYGIAKLESDDESYETIALVRESELTDEPRT